MNIQVLDCTLRDGGYINNWDFGESCIQQIITRLMDAKLDIIEVGFLDNSHPFSKDSTLFPSTVNVNNVIPQKGLYNGDFVAMVMLGKCPIENIQEAKDSSLDGIRVCFRKQQLQEAVDYSREILKKGYKLFWQPASLTDYSDSDVLTLVEQANRIQPAAVYMVDTYGLMHKNDVIHYFSVFNNNLDKNIAIGFHSHNNLQLSFSNSLALFDMLPNRDLIVDSSVFGMGRGAGNLCTELLTKYLNDNYNQHYYLVPILEIVDDNINPIFKRLPWGYSVAYYVAAINNCHPNYASFLVNKQTVGVKKINDILGLIPEPYKRNYNQDLIEQLYIENLKIDIDDQVTIEKIKTEIGDRKVLVVAPGKSILDYQDTLVDFVKKENPWIVSVNFKWESADSDMLFISNLKRFSSFPTLHQIPIRNIVITSNLADQTNIADFLIVNYSSLTYNNTEEADNAGMMVLRLLQRAEVRNVYVAGYDGFNPNPYENYHSDTLRINMPTEIIESKNQSIANQLKELLKALNIQFITPSIYPSLIENENV